MDSPLHRFKSEDTTDKNRRVQPSDTVYFYNLPGGMANDEISRVCTLRGYLLIRFDSSFNFAVLRCARRRRPARDQAFYQAFVPCT